MPAPQLAAFHLPKTPLGREGAVSISEFIRTYQTFVVGLLGFAGVITTLIVNAALQRVQERRKEHREVLALRTALLEELKLEKASLERTVVSLDETINENTQTAFYLNLHRFDRVFYASIERLGLLPSHQIRPGLSPSP
jgi:hypothetical protein